MVELGCGMKCAKYILFIVNLLVFLIGVAAVAVGIWALVDKDNKLDPLTKINVDTGDFNVVGLLQTGAIVMIVGGGIVMIVAFLGCFGAVKESTCMICLYAFLLILILALEIAAVALAAIFRSKFESEAKEFLKKTINSTYQGVLSTDEPFSLAMDFAQVKFECCGVDSYTDFYGAEKWNRTTDAGELKIPPSCCMMKSTDSFFDDPSKAELKNTNCTLQGVDSYENKSCWTSILEYFKERALYVLGVAIGVVIVELFCIIAACCLWTELRKD